MAKRVITHANNNLLFFAYFGIDTCKSLGQLRNKSNKGSGHSQSYLCYFI